MFSKTTFVWLFVLCKIILAQNTDETTNTPAEIDATTPNTQDIVATASIPDDTTDSQNANTDTTNQETTNAPTETYEEKTDDYTNYEDILENEAKNGLSENKMSTESPIHTTEELSNVICEACECIDGVVDCRNRNLNSPFELTDWDDIIPLQPTTVDLSQNPLTLLTRISNVSSIQYLNISNCKIEFIEWATFSYLSNLVSLDLSGNMLATAAVSKRIFVGILVSNIGILPFSNLRYLSLANNDVHSLSQDIFAFMLDLTSLDLSGNPLGYIDQVTMGAITDLENLKELNLSGCQLETLPAGMFRRNRLKRLDVSNNKFKTVPLSLGEAVTLEYLDFGRNLVEIFNGSGPISNMKKLKELRLSRLSKLQRVTDQGLGGLESLEVLDLSFNPKLAELEDEFLTWTDEHTEQETWPALKELYLNNNNLTRVYSGYLERWDLLSRVDISNNPFMCDCSNQWIVDVFVPLIRSTPSNTTLGNMICKKPKEMKGISFTQLQNVSKELACPETQDLLTGGGIPDMAIILGIIIGIFVTFPILLVVILLWRRGFFARCRSRRIESDEDDDVFVKLRTLNEPPIINAR